MEAKALEIVLLSTSQKQYADQNVVQVTGQVSLLDSPTVLLGVYAPSGMPVGFYFGNVDSNLEFATIILAKDGVNFKVDGTYSIKDRYAQNKATYFF